MSKRRKIPEQNYAARVYPWQLSQIPEDQSTHDELFYAFQQYYKINQHWLTYGTSKAAVDSRYWLLEIRRLALSRKQFLDGWSQKIKDKTNSNRNTRPVSLKKIQELARLATEENKEDED